MTTIRRIGIAIIAGVTLASCVSTKTSQHVERSTIPLNYLPSLMGDYFDLSSKENGRTYHIYVRLPEHYSTDPVTIRYPLVYLLDGDSTFPMLAPEHQFLNYDEKLPDAIVVGIAYGSFDPKINKRGIDFTGPADGVKPEEAGAPAFARYLKTELIPTIEKKYRGDSSRRILFGQSRGGSFVLYSAFTDPDLFWGRIASNAAFTPDSYLHLSDATTFTRRDLGLVVTSGTRDMPKLRQGALNWFKQWDGVKSAPWAIKAVTIEGGTHAADAANSYRAGMLWLFGRE